MNRPPARPRPMTCWLCGKRFAGRYKSVNRICDRPQCRQVRSQIIRLRRLTRVEERCLFCSEVPVEGRKVCGRHTVRREPCRGCGGPVPYQDRQGNQRTYCQKCRPFEVDRV